MPIVATARGSAGARARTVNRGIVLLAMTTRFAAAAPVVAALLLLAACTPGPALTPSPTPQPAISYPGWPPQASGELVPIPVLSEIVVGDNRFLLHLVDQANEPLASPDRGVTLNFYDLAADPATAATSAQGAYMPTVGTLPGLYRAHVSFDRAGEWGLEVVTAEPDGTSRSGRMVFAVRQESSTPALGAQAPASLTPTAATPDQIAEISTDSQPNPAFYRTSVDEALAAGEPFLVVFATPAFCQTAVCGPTMDIIKSVAPEFEDRVAFIHVEPYELAMTDGHLQPVLTQGRLTPVESVAEWGLLTEPYIFVVDREGRISAKMEGVASAEEIRQALTQVAD